MSAVTVAASGIQGLGVFAARDFEPGELVLTIDDSRLVDQAHPLRPELGEFERHCDYLADGLVVLMLSPERHINHSCDPNTYVKTINGARRVLALKPLHAGDEITYDYIINCHGGIVWECNCGAPRCRKVIPASYFDLPLEWQAAYLPLLDDWFAAEHAEKLAALQRSIHEANLGR